MIKIAILGYGTIGSGVVEVLDTNRESIAKRAGDEIEVKYILDLRDFPGDPMEGKVIHDYGIIAEDPEIQVVVEAMGGVEPAYTFVKRALLAGKSVTTSNKALVAKHGAELIAIAKEQGINFLFEASVGGGIPIIRPLNSSLTADEIQEITGILNGTTNYMLSKMTFEGLEFDDVLKDAQSRGYAEADPTADIEGYDACRKIAILTSLVCGQQVDFEEIAGKRKKATAPWLRRLCWHRGIPCTMSTMCLTLFSSMGMCWATLCFTAAAQGSSQLPAQLWRILWTLQSTSTSIS